MLGSPIEPLLESPLTNIRVPLHFVSEKMTTGYETPRDMMKRDTLRQLILHSYHLPSFLINNTTSYREMAPSFFPSDFLIQSASIQAAVNICAMALITVAFVFVVYFSVRLIREGRRYRQNNCKDLVFDSSFYGDRNMKSYKGSLKTCEVYTG